MLVTRYTAEDLKKLPLRAIAAFAARCARRVEAFAQLPEGHPEAVRRKSAIDATIQQAEEFARGSSAAPDDSTIRRLDVSRGVHDGGPGCVSAAASAAQAGHAAVSAWQSLDAAGADRKRPSWEVTPEARDSQAHLTSLTADLAALGAYAAAVEAADAVGYNDAFINGAERDYRSLLGLHLGSYPDAGNPVDPSPGGPLGPL